MRIAKSPEADAPGIDDELISLQFIEVPEQCDALGAPIADVRRDFVG
jgi:hypothetical protein